MKYVVQELKLEIEMYNKKTGTDVQMQIKNKFIKLLNSNSLI